MFKYLRRKKQHNSLSASCIRHYLFVVLMMLSIPVFAKAPHKLINNIDEVLAFKFDGISLLTSVEDAIKIAKENGYIHEEKSSYTTQYFLKGDYVIDSVKNRYFSVPGKVAYQLEIEDMPERKRITLSRLPASKRLPVAKNTPIAINKNLIDVKTAIALKELICKGMIKDGNRQYYCKKDTDKMIRFGKNAALSDDLNLKSLFIFPNHGGIRIELKKP